MKRRLFFLVSCLFLLFGYWYLYPDDCIYITFDEGKVTIQSPTGIDYILASDGHYVDTIHPCNNFWYDHREWVDWLPGDQCKDWLYARRAEVKFKGRGVSYAYERGEFQVKTLEICTWDSKPVCIHIKIENNKATLMQINNLSKREVIIRSDAYCQRVRACY